MNVAVPQPIRVQTARDVLELLGEQINALRADLSLGTVERARTLGSLAGMPETIPESSLIGAAIAAEDTDARREVEKRKTHRALDLQHAVAGEKHRSRVGVDAADLLGLAAIGRRIGEKRQYFLLRVGRFVHAAGILLAGVHFCFR